MNIDEKTGIMAASPSMKEILNYMDNIIQKKSQSPKMVIHGGHDSTISYFQYFMQYVFKIPIQYIPFASNIYFELHKNETEDESPQYYVEYILDGKSLLIMDYTEFKTKVLNAIWSDGDINNFCYPSEKKENKTENYFSEYEKYKSFTYIFLSTTIFLFISTIVMMVLFIIYIKKYKKYSGNLLSGDSILDGKKNSELQLL